MDFMLGVNYWGSEAGTETWRCWDEKSAERDLKLLSEYGVKYMRVFPNWRDFQPVHKLKTIQGKLREYRLHGTDIPKDEFMLDESMLSRFKSFCGIAEKYGLRLIVSLVTGWMSGMLFCPPALENKNLITDSEALMLETKFVRGFVRKLKNERAIFAWDLGNECNCLGEVTDRSQAWLWTSTIANSIRCEDNSRMVMSGMHGLTDSPESYAWSIAVQGELTDVLTPHPYPSPTVGGENDPLNAPKNTYIPTFQCEYYSALGKKPAMIQELGTFCNSIGGDKEKCDSMRANVFSAWANGAKGYLWWCAHEQNGLDFPPYEWCPLERELGLFYADYSPKPIAKEMKSLSDALSSLPTLPEKEIDGVFINLESRDATLFDDATGAYILAKQAGLNLTFFPGRDVSRTLPDAPLYILAAHEMWGGIYRTHFEELKKKVKDGAVLLITHDDGMINEFETLTGLVSHGVSTNDKRVTVDFGDFKLSDVYTGKELMTDATTAKVLARSENGNIMLSENDYGKGKVFFANFPLEYIAFTSHRRIDKPELYPYYKIYKTAARDILDRKPLSVADPLIGATYHKINDDEYYVTLINYSPEKRNIGIVLNGFEAHAVYGSPDVIGGCDMAVVKLTKKK